MSTEQSDTHAPEQTGGLHAVGQRLAAARRQQQREVSAVASNLHLRPDVVEALEAGDESKLPAGAFVRGYVKSYARLLGLGEDELMALLPSSEDFRLKPLKRVGMGRRRSISLPIGKWLLWIAVLLLLAALVVYGVPFAERLLNRVEHQTSEDSLPLPLNGEESSQSQPLLELPPLDAEYADEESVQVQPDTTEEIPAVAEESAAEDEVVGTSPDAPVEQVVAAPEGAETPENKPEPSAASGPATVVLQFSQDSWVEMESNGRKLVVGTQSAGSERTVRAEPPISILLGNAPGVVLIYRGERVDLQPYRRGKVARLVLED